MYGDDIKTIISISDTQKGIIRILKSAIKSSNETLGDGFDWNEAHRIIKEHHIEVLCYYGLKNMGIAVPTWLRDDALKETAFLTRLWHEANRLMEIFHSEGIEYVKLKGIKNKDLYPNQFMRHMGDVDLLVRESDYTSRIKPIMEANGWKLTDEGYDSHWAKSGLHLEIHTALLPPDYGDLAIPMKDSWNWIKGREDVFDVVHYARHLRQEPFGMLHFIDLFFLDRIDLSELKEFELSEFYLNALKTLEYWFENGYEDAMVTVFSNVVFCNENVIAHEGTSKVNVKLLIKKMFPPLSSWKTKIPILNKIPLLLPVFWIIRLISLPVNKKFRSFLKKDLYYYYENKNLEYIGLKSKSELIFKEK